MCIIGPNGCGKTTLLNCVLAFNDVPKDSVYINGSDILSLNRNDIARSISYVQQASDNESTLKVRDYLLTGRIAHKKLYQRPDENDEMIVCNAAEKLGIKSMLSKALTELSGGEKQLVMIAKALVQDTEIIIMDEPASALDFGNQARLLRLIKHLNHEGKTIIFTTHNPNHAIALDSKVCIMKDGTIDSVGAVDFCITSQKMSEIYGSDLSFVSEKNGISCKYSIENNKM